MDVATELTYVTRSVGRPGFYNYKPPEGSPDVAPETHLDERVNKERVQEGEKDLLESGRPVE